MLKANRDNLKRTLSSKLVSSSQAAEMLEVSRQRFSVIAKEKKLDPVFVSSQGSLYLRTDIEDLKSGIIRNEKKKPLFICDGSTRSGLQEFVEKRNFLKEITHIFVYFDTFDAILDGFYIPCENLSDFKELESPRFVLRDKEGRELWFKNCNCGYGGAGPSETMQILMELGMDKDSAEIVRDSSFDMIKFFKQDNGEFEIIPRKSVVKRVTNSSIRIFYFGGNLVGLQNKNGFGTNNSTMFLEEYSSILPDLKDVILINSKDEAQKLGYVYGDNFGHETVYQLIFRDNSGKQLWLSPNVNDTTPLKYQKSIKDLLSMCGIVIEEQQETSLPHKIINFLKQVPHVKTSEIIKVEGNYN